MHLSDIRACTQRMSDSRHANCLLARHGIGFVRSTFADDKHRDQDLVEAISDLSCPEQCSTHNDDQDYRAGTRVNCIFRRIAEAIPATSRRGRSIEDSLRRTTA